MKIEQNEPTPFFFLSAFSSWSSPPNPSSSLFGFRYICSNTILTTQNCHNYRFVQCCLINDQNINIFIFIKLPHLHCDIVIK